MVRFNVKFGTVFVEVEKFAGHPLIARFPRKISWENNISEMKIHLDFALNSSHKMSSWPYSANYSCVYMYVKRKMPIFLCFPIITRFGFHHQLKKWAAKSQINPLGNGLLLVWFPNHNWNITQSPWSLIFIFCPVAMYTNPAQKTSPQNHASNFQILQSTTQNNTDHLFLTSESWIDFYAI